MTAPILLWGSALNGSEDAGKIERIFITQTRRDALDRQVRCVQPLASLVNAQFRQIIHGSITSFLTEENVEMGACKPG